MQIVVNFENTSQLDLIKSFLVQSGFEKDLKDLPKNVVEKIIPAVMALADNPRPSRVAKNSKVANIIIEYA
jgi:mRNA-degrading endonuclease RelE of RelBE toxin-antitoxin system